jgi:hypothetical protein
MQTPTPNQNPYQYTYTPNRKSSNGLIQSAFLISLFAFILIVLAQIAYSYVISPAGVIHFRPTRGFYNGIMYIQFFLGLLGTLGFVFGMIGVTSAVRQKSEFNNFQGIASLAFGFIGVLTLIEYALRLLQTLFKVF